MRHLLVIIACLLSGAALATETVVRSQAEYRDAVKSLQPGDSIVLANGEWSDFEVLFTGNGTADEPITLTAQTKGQVVLTGQSNLRLAGEHLVVSGLVFKNGYTPTNEVISFRRNKQELANHSRVTEVVIDHFNNPERYEVDFWVMMYGKHNRFDHNHLEGKSNKGVTMAVRLDSEQSLDNHHRIDHNYFGPRPILGSNGGETLRIGTSHYAHTNSRTVVENNYFDRCNGEVEIISSKSGRNVFRGNLFHESRGTLTLRHGDGNLVENNVFLGNRKPHTGGIRVINRDQIVRNNYLHGLTGYRFGSGLTVMNGVPNSPANRYVQVSNATIENNTIIDSDHVHLGAGSDAERSAPPIDSVFRNNLIHNSTGADPFSVFDDISGIAFSDNLLNEVAEPTVSDGFRSGRVKLRAADNGLLYPSSRRLAGYGVKRGLTKLDRAETGVAWYPKPGPEGPFGTGESTPVEPGENTLTNAIQSAQAGDTLLLAAGSYLVTKLPRIEFPLTIRASGELTDTPQALIEFERSALLELGDGASLELIGLHLSGAQAPDNGGNSLLRTTRYSMLNNYQLRIDHCLVTDLDINHSFNVLSVAKHTFADAITITNSEFRDISGHILQLDREVDDLGIYNAEYITIADSKFSNIGGTIADIYRGGTDESTFGPQLRMHRSSLANVGHNKRNKNQSSLQLHGVQVTSIEHNELTNSQPVRVVHTVGEPKTRIEDNQLRDTAAAVVKQYSAADDACGCEGRQ